MLEIDQVLLLDPLRLVILYPIGKEFDFFLCAIRGAFLDLIKIRPKMKNDKDTL
jgi:hypothetical protein